MGVLRSYPQKSSFFIRVDAYKLKYVLYVNEQNTLFVMNLQMCILRGNFISLFSIRACMFLVQQGLAIRSTNAPNYFIREC